jgi:hypothetical protein
MIGNFVIRLLDADNNLIAWAKQTASPTPQEGRASCPFFGSVTKFVAERNGVITKMTIEWSDLGIARQRDLDILEVKTGQGIDFIWVEPIWLVAGSKDVPLPPVTEQQPVVIGVKPASMGTKDPRA